MLAIYLYRQNHKPLSSRSNTNKEVEENDAIYVVSRSFIQETYNWWLHQASTETLRYLKAANKLYFIILRINTWH